MVMTHKQRILAAAGKQPVDKLPFGARIDLWYNYHRAHGTLPEKYNGWSEVGILRDLGVGFQIMGTEVNEVDGGPGGQIKLTTFPVTFWKEEFPNMEVVVSKEGVMTTTEYRTPKGTVSAKLMFDRSEGYEVGYMVEHLFKSEKDYPAIEYLIENRALIPDYSAYLGDADVIMEDGVVVCGLPTSPMQFIMLDVMGYETFFYELADNPQKVDHLYEVAKEQWKRGLDIVADSPAELVVIDDAWSDETHTPVFRKYFAPWLRETTEFLHNRGKLTRIHTDGEMRRLIPFFLETGNDVFEAWCPSPMTSVTTAELRKALDDKATVWGGIPIVVFEPMYSDEEFDNYVINLFKEIAPGNSFIVGMGDNFPIDGDINRVRRVAELIDKYAALPIQI